MPKKQQKRKPVSKKRPVKVEGEAPPMFPGTQIPGPVPQNVVIQAPAQPGALELPPIRYRPKFQKSTKQEDDKG
jgi:hypothetical protein